MNAMVKRAQEILADVANVHTNAMAKRLVDQGICLWVEDPDYSGVVGLVHVDNQRDAAILVYVDEEDFEVSGRYEHESYTGQVTV